MRRGGDQLDRFGVSVRRCSRHRLDGEAVRPITVVLASTEESIDHFRGVAGPGGDEQHERTPLRYAQDGVLEAKLLVGRLEEAIEAATVRRLDARERRDEAVSLTEVARAGEAVAKIRRLQQSRCGDTAEQRLRLRAVEAGIAVATQSQQRLDLVFQFQSAHRLRQKIGGAEHERTQSFTRSRDATRCHQHRHVDVGAAQRAEQFVAADARHDQVEDHQVWVVRDDLRERLETIDRGNYLVALPEPIADQFALHATIFDQQDQAARARFGRRRREQRGLWRVVKRRGSRRLVTVLRRRIDRPDRRCKISVVALPLERRRAPLGHATRARE
jgi:hypothetical protein